MKMNEKAGIRASVAMAVYNGEKYVEEQIDSILRLMGSNDEMIISYNESDDNTWNIIKGYERKDNRVHVFIDNMCTVESNFNNAVKNCVGKYIFLSDQDDVWIDGKIDKMVAFFEDHPDCVILIGDGYMTDRDLNKEARIFKCFKTSRSPLRNYIKGSYLGCQMAFVNNIKDLVWPVSVSPPIAHDLWLGVYGGFFGKIYLFHEATILHRLHDKNYTLTSKMDFRGVVKDRSYFLGQLVKRYTLYLRSRRR